MFWRQIQMFQCFCIKWCIKNAIQCFHNSDPNFGVIKTPSGLTQTFSFHIFNTVFVILTPIGFGKTHMAALIILPGRQFLLHLMDHSKLEICE